MSGISLEIQVLNYVDRLPLGAVWRLREHEEISLSSGIKVKNPEWTKILKHLEAEGLVMRRVVRRAKGSNLNFYNNQRQVSCYRVTDMGLELLKELGL